MADNSNINLSSDVQVIREILFGEHLQNIQGKIQELENAVSDLKKENHQLKKALEAETQQRQHDAQVSRENLENESDQIQTQLKSQGEELSMAIENLRQGSTKSLEDLNQKFEERIEKLVKDIAAQQSEHQALHDNLVSSLATALLKFQPKAGAQDGKR